MFTFFGGQESGQFEDERFSRSSSEAIIFIEETSSACGAALRGRPTFPCHLLNREKESWSGRRANLMPTLLDGRATAPSGGQSPWPPLPTLPFQRDIRSSPTKLRHKKLDAQTFRANIHFKLGLGDEQLCKITKCTPRHSFVKVL